MVSSEYCRLLGIPENSSIEEIKKAYRKKARLYHPDINHSPDAKDQFIQITEAYDFLVNNHGKGLSEEEDYARAMDEWRRYRQDRSRQRARYYARGSYPKFKNSRYYRSTKILNGPSIIFNFAISIMVFIFTILGFILRLRNPLPDEEGSPVFSFLLLMLLSVILFTVSFIYLKAYIETNRKQKRKK